MDDRNTVNILGVHVDKVNMAEALEKVNAFLGSDGLKTVFTPNTEMVMASVTDREFSDILNGSDLVVPDGIGLVYASKRYGDPLPERVAGFDLMIEMLNMISREGRSVFLLGGKPGTADRAADEISARFPGVTIKGCHHGYFDESESDEIIKQINALKPDVLFVALGSPKQEKWISRNKNILNARIAMGVGGSFDVLAGNIKRAPAVFRKVGMEWFYRLITQPWRARRMLVLPVFAVKVLMDRKRVK